jgi:probable HAF family extracellular repeat protein
MKSALLVLALALPLSAQNYTFTKLVASGDFPYGHVNASGQVAATANVDTPTQAAFLWTRSGGIQYLGTLGGEISAALWINDSGAIVGSSALPGNMVTHAFLWTQSAGMQDLGTTFAGGSSAAAMINDAGEVWGITENPGGAVEHGFYWSQSTGMIDLGTLGGSFSFPAAMNSAGEIVGESYKAGTSPSYAFSWTQATGIVNLDPSSSDEVSAANWINDSGEIVGVVKTELQTYLPGIATLWEPNGSQVALGTLPGDNVSSASFINSSGNIAGCSGNEACNDHMFFWSPSGGMINTGAPSYGSILGMNDNNQILFQEMNTTPYLWSQTGGIQLVHHGSNQGVAPDSFTNAGQLLMEFDGYLNLGTPVMYVGLTSSPNPSIVGQNVAFTATVSSVIGPPPNGDQVTFYLSNKKLGSGTVSNGQAIFSTTTLPQGSDQIKAKYMGDQIYLGSAPAVLTQVVNP